MIFTDVAKVMKTKTVYCVGPRIPRPWWFWEWLPV